MFKVNNLQKLYPNIKLPQVAPHIIKVDDEPKVIPAPAPAPAPAPTRDRSPSPPPTIQRPKKVSSPIVGKPQILIDQPLPALSRIALGEPKRDSVVPKKGENGLQRKYSDEQKRDMILKKLSKMSVAKAESKCNEIVELIEEHDGIEGLKQEEKQIKQKLKLINTAKFFATGLSITQPENVTETDQDALCE